MGCNFLIWTVQSGRCSNAMAMTPTNLSSETECVHQGLTGRVPNSPWSFSCWRSLLDCNLPIPLLACPDPEPTVLVLIWFCSLVPAADKIFALHPDYLVAQCEEQQLALRGWFGVVTYQDRLLLQSFISLLLEAFTRYHSWSCIHPVNHIYAHLRCAV